MAETDRGAAPPNHWLRLMEARAVFELGSVLAAAPWLRMIGRGDNHPVLILPGFLADDSSTLPLRYILRGQGYWVDGWDLGRNVGPTPHIVDGLIAKLQMMHDRHDSPVTLIGWSLGGIYARRLARKFPHLVRQVITLGSPFRINPEDRSAVSRIYDRLSPQHIPLVEEALPGHDAGELLVPASSIYTRSDGVVRWWQCLDDEGPIRENIEVYGSHSGLGFNPAAIFAITDRLAQKPGEWKKFKAPPGTSQFFPKPATWRPTVAA